MGLAKVVIFLPSVILSRYDRLAKRARVSRSETLRTAAELAFDLVRDRYAARIGSAAAAPAAASPGSGAAARADVVVAAMRNAATIVLRAQPEADAGLLREVLLDEAAKYPDVVLPAGAVDALVEEFTDAGSPELHALPGDEPPR